MKRNDRTILGLTMLAHGMVHTYELSLAHSHPGLARGVRRVESHPRRRPLARLRAVRRRCVARRRPFGQLRLPTAHNRVSARHGRVVSPPLLRSFHSHHHARAPALGNGGERLPSLRPLPAQYRHRPRGTGERVRLPRYRRKRRHRVRPAGDDAPPARLRMASRRRHPRGPRASRRRSCRSNLHRRDGRGRGGTRGTG